MDSPECPKAALPCQPRAEHIAYGHVHFSEVDSGAKDGELIYVKPTLARDQP